MFMIKFYLHNYVSQAVGLPQATIISSPVVTAIPSSAPGGVGTTSTIPQNIAVRPRVLTSVAGIALLVSVATALPLAH